MRSSPAAAAAKLPSTCESRAAYGRAAITRSWARRSLAAETVFMALVICCRLRTDRMRRRMSIRLGMLGGGRLQLGNETLLEVFDGLRQFGAQRVVKVFLLA